jgi:hypothetical protein
MQLIFLLILVLSVFNTCAALICFKGDEAHRQVVRLTITKYQQNMCLFQTTCNASSTFCTKELFPIIPSPSIYACAEASMCPQGSKCVDGAVSPPSTFCCCTFNMCNDANFKPPLEKKKNCAQMLSTTIVGGIVVIGISLFNL